MKDIIFEIIKENIFIRIVDGKPIDYIKGGDDAAKKIIIHIMEFIQWLHDNTDDTRDIDNDSLWWVIPLEYYIPIEEVYQYWLTNIKNK